jgi:hypothetical protein
MGKIRKWVVHPGDILVVAGERLEVNKTVEVLTSSEKVAKIPTPGTYELPETKDRVDDVYKQHIPTRLELRTDLRCPCGSLHTRKGEKHTSCLRCKRMWTNEEVSNIESYSSWSPF